MRLRPGSVIDSLCCESHYIKSLGFFRKKKKGSVGQMVRGSSGKQPIPCPWRLVPRGEPSKELPRWGRVGRGLFILLIDRSASSAAGTPAAFSFCLSFLLFPFLPQQDRRSGPPAGTRTKSPADPPGRQVECVLMFVYVCVS